MADSLRQERDVKRRIQQKCSWCRQKRIFCSRDRNQDPLPPCEYCIKTNKPCTRDYRSSDDPGVPGQQAAVPIANGLATGLRVRQQPALERAESFPALSPLAANSMDSFSENGREVRFRHLETLQIKDLAFETLRELNALQETLALTTQDALRPRTCLGQTTHPWTSDIHALIERTHKNFKDVCSLALEVDCRDQHDMAGWILSKLMIAGNVYPQIYDGRKRAVLIRMAKFFRRQQDHDSEKFLLTQIANISDTSNMPLEEDYVRDLADALDLASKNSCKSLQDVWQRYYQDRPPSNLLLSPQVLATQSCNANVISAVSKYLPLGEERPGIFNIQSLHIAAATGCLPSLKTLTEIPRHIEARDEFGRTPILLAAANGQAECLRHLLEQGAQPNTRDSSHGHSALELAARSGSLECVQLLTFWKADVNPEMVGKCASSPLQAAFEGETVNDKVVWHLINVGGNPRWARRHDHKTAITLAKERGESAFAEVMEKNASEQSLPDNMHRAFLLPGPADDPDFR